ncbi:uncharacterized protein ARMOST_01375 [Armillaria ostoyae]|uniref:Protein kinase domain-containing protein n=1 Tax=Armillaria ostoyae TaxID=47428 RepID=A0A284QNT0_ARMOS|nr:uncharacterized protein ARMOST_01375 [Armillaria ostoyae]
MAYKNDEVFLPGNRFAPNFKVASANVDCWEWENQQRAWDTSGVVLEERERLLHQIVMEQSIRSLGSLLRKSQGGLPGHLKTRFCLDVAAGLKDLRLIEVDAPMSSQTTSSSSIRQQIGLKTAPHVDRASLMSDFASPIRLHGILPLVQEELCKTPETLYEAPPSFCHNLPQRDLYSYGVMIWEVVDGGRLPFLTVSDANVPSLQLSAEDGASDSFIKSGVGYCPQESQYQNVIA